MAPGFDGQYVDRIARQPASDQRLISVGRDGRLWTCGGEPCTMTADQLFAVLVMWEASACPDDQPWIGWLTTLDHRAVRFSSADLDDAVFQLWLRHLPSWIPDTLAHALVSPGMHLVWRRLRGQCTLPGQ